jgi:hypothetical protein
MMRTLESRTHPEPLKSSPTLVATPMKAAANAPPVNGFGGSTNPFVTADSCPLPSSSPPTPSGVGGSGFGGSHSSTSKNPFAIDVAAADTTEPPSAPSNTSGDGGGDGGGGGGDGGDNCDGDGDDGGDGSNIVASGDVGVRGGERGSRPSRSLTESDSASLASIESRIPAK